MNKPILLLSSSNLSSDIDALYSLRGYASLLNLEDQVSDDEIKQYLVKNVVVCNMNDPQQVAKLRFIPHASVYRVCVLRKTESATAPWVLKCASDYIIKETNFLKNCKNIAEVLTYIMHLSNFKQPDGFIMFWLKKLSFLLACLK